MPRRRPAPDDATLMQIVRPNATAHAAVAVIRRLPRLLGRSLISAYRYSLSGLVGFHCRHLPTCSAYAEEAVDRFGLWAGGWMTLARLCRCHPWGTSGLDFVPESRPAAARWFLPWRYGRWRGVNAPPPAVLIKPQASPPRAG